MKEKKSILAVGVVVEIGLLVLIVFATLLGVQVTAQQQTMPADAHHAENNNSNQSGSGMAEQQQQQQNTTTLSGMVTKNQTFNTNWISLVSGVKVTGISVIDTEHIAVNLRYDGEGAPPGVSVVAVVDITNSSSGTIIGSNMMQQDSMMMGQEGEMMREMIMAGNQQSNSSSVGQELQQHDQQQQMQNSTSTSNSSVQVSSMQSGSNYLEAGWRGQESNSATILIQLDGDMTEGGHIMVIVIPFLHH
jgi:hypothetical protein